MRIERYGCTFCFFKINNLLFKMLDAKRYGTSGSKNYDVNKYSHGHLKTN